MKRRTYLVGTATAVTAIAGCGSPGAGVDGTETEPVMGGTETGTQTGTGTETEAGTETTTGTQTTAGTQAGGGGAPAIQMVTEGDAFYFDPVGVAVEPGTTVEWTNESGSHSSTAYQDRVPGGAQPWDSGVLSEVGATFSHTFDTEGTYDYFCTPHQSLGMVARIVVGQPGGPAEGSMPPDGEVPQSQQIVDQGTVSYDSFTGG